MPININGNVINRFGDRLPVPYLDNITIYNNELHLRLSIYFENIVNEESSTFFSEYLESMSQLNYVIQIIMDGKLSETSDIYIPAATDEPRLLALPAILQKNWCMQKMELPSINFQKNSSSNQPETELLVSIPSKPSLVRCLKV